MTSIRPAAAGDRQAVEAIVADAYSHHVSRIGRGPGPMLDDDAALIAAGRVRVAVVGGAIRGLLVIVPQGDALLLDNVAVAPAAQGSGIGRAWLTDAEDAARDAGFRRIRLYTHDLMTENIALYARLGYVETHRVEEIGIPTGLHGQVRLG